MRLRGGTLSMLIGLLVLAGCASSAGPEELVIEPGRYSAAFDAAVEAARSEGMPPEVRDRRAGLIETAPRPAASIIEPWRQDNASFEQAMENTTTFQRRRVRFEFAPANAPPPRLPPPEGQPLTGADAAGLGAPAPAVDLTTYNGAIRVDVIVTLERMHRPGQRRSMWTRRFSTQTLYGGEKADLPTSFWTPIARDPAYEQRLLAQIEAAIDRETDLAE